MKIDDTHSVVIIGAGAAGVGLGVAFEKMGLKDYVILERDVIASSFRQWPEYTRFISPSFTGNAFNLIDLNAITPDTSPAYSLKTEHPSGKLYAKYLTLIASHFTLPIQQHTNVIKIEKQDDLFLVHTPDKVFQTKFVVWAGGEFQYPAMLSIPGAEQCVHSSQLHDYQEDSATIIGGYESGMDLAVHLLRQGKDVTIIDRGEPWEVNVSDSSLSLSPYTRDRLRPYIGSEHLKLIGNAEVIKITEDANGYMVYSKEFAPIASDHAPILATGFANLPSVVDSFFTVADEGHIALTCNDESTITTNLFLAGPKVQHDKAIFCFIYKFRQRLPIIAETIVERMGIGADGLAEYKKLGMYLKDLSQCVDECAC